ncbi:hypothetical protein CMT41_02195 [Colwellia sp. MT41]|uniref:hypothetical protein n=1 Tax=Colwellia sp. MT41 TaxID=58049 RepID=UPI00071758E6|nr:hypothetical protein [Colwellia sp. MT41]ALO33654.1 hypothetical protein CMT41_02195 [Colwellia sp. MT41]
MKKIVRATLAASIALALTACHNDKKTPPVVDIPPPTTLEISGGAVKGTLIGATVTLFSAADLTTAIGDSVQTGTDGSYTLTLTDTTGGQISGAYVVKVTADDDTTMICDAAVKCGEVLRGDLVQATDLDGLVLSSFTFADSEVSDAAAVNVNALSTMATDAILAAASVEGTAIDLSNLTAEKATALKIAGSEVVGAIIGVDLAGVDLFSLNIVDASVSENVPTDNINASTLTLVNASLANINVITDGSTVSTVGYSIKKYFESVNEIATAIFENPGVDLGADNSVAMNRINLVQAEISIQAAEILTLVDPDGKIDFKPIPAQVVPEEITKIIGEIVVGTGGTGGEG